MVSAFLRVLFGRGAHGLRWQQRCHAPADAPASHAGRASQYIVCAPFPSTAGRWTRCSPRARSAPRCSPAGERQRAQEHAGGRAHWQPAVEALLQLAML